MARKQLPFVLLASLTLVAKPQGMPAQLRDSAGVRIVENAMVQSSHYTLSASPLVTMSNDWVRGPDDTLGSVRGALVLRDGGVAVADGGRSQLDIFDRAGVHRKHLGTRGAGERAGEFNFIGGILALGGNRIGVWDGATNRLTTLGVAGAISGWQHFDDPPYVQRPYGRTRLRTTLLGKFRDGRFFGIQHTVRDQGLTRIFAESLTVGVMSIAGRWTPIANLDRGEYFSFLGPKFGVAGVIPFGRVGALATGPSSWYYSDGRSFEVKEFSPAGQLLRIIRMRRDQTAVTPADVENFKGTMLHRTIPERRETIQAALKWMRLPTLRAAYTSLRADSRGNLWGRVWALPGSKSVWDIFSPEGRVIAWCEIPPDLELLEIGDDFVLARHDDPLTGQQEVRRYGLDRAPGSRLP